MIRNQLYCLLDEMSILKVTRSASHVSRSTSLGFMDLFAERVSDDDPFLQTGGAVLSVSNLYQHGSMLISDPRYLVVLDDKNHQAFTVEIRDSKTEPAYRAGQSEDGIEELTQETFHWLQTQWEQGLGRTWS
ncbi:MAG: hypothetical protein KDJ38_00195 [Gammaproteobacteria bacterium]|nr:hypothetical protein [Gammaproteobacteria bacterium]